MIQGKSSTQLVVMQEQIRARISAGDAADMGSLTAPSPCVIIAHICVRYWETLLVFLKAYLSKARLRETHQKLLERTLTLLRSSAMHAEPSFADRHNKRFL